MPDLYLVRHGQTEWSLAGRHTGRTDIPLTEQGKAQATALQAAVKAVAFEHAYTSPLSRAKETARLAGFPNATTSDDLLEVNYGDYEGLTATQIRETVPNWTVWTHPIANGESLDDAYERAQSFLRTVSSVEGNIIIFSHGHFLRVLTTAWLQIEPYFGRHLMLDTCTISILSHEREAPAIKMWNAQASMSG